MNRRALHIVLCALATVFAGGDAYAQLMPERRLIRKGNRDYEKGDYAESEVDYLRAKEKSPQSFEANFNLGNSYYKQGRFEEAAAAYSKPAPLGMSAKGAAQSFYNAGNALFRQQKLEEALESYKQSLRLNPYDMEAKFNLAYVKKLLEKDQQQNQDDQNQDNQDDQQDQNQQNQEGQNDQQNQNDQQGQGDDQQNQDGEGQDGNNDRQNENQNGRDDQNNNPQEQGSGQQPSGMTRQEAEQLLDAMEMSDEKTREKVDEKKGRIVGGSTKNW